METEKERDVSTRSLVSILQSLAGAHNVNKRTAGKIKREKKTKWRSVCGMLVKHYAVKCSLAIDNA